MVTVSPRLSWLAFPTGFLSVVVFFFIGPSRLYADKLILKTGESVFGRIVDERDSLVRYVDRHDRPRKMAASKIDSVIYDANELNGLVKVAYRKGLPKDWTGYLTLRHSDELDLDVIYQTDSTTELDLFFRNGVHARVLEQTRFRVEKAPKGAKAEAHIRLLWGGVVAEGYHEGALLKVIADHGVGTLRGVGRLGFQALASDSTITVACLRGLVGVQEKMTDFGEFVVEPGANMSFVRREGLFHADTLNSEVGKTLAWQAENMGHYVFEPVVYPPVGYLPRALTGLGFLVFFYGSTLGVLDYVNHL
jgi:hypothetical protein